MHEEFEQESELQELEREVHRMVADVESQQKDDRKIDLGLGTVKREGIGPGCRPGLHRFVASLAEDSGDSEDCAHSNWK